MFGNPWIERPTIESIYLQQGLKHCCEELVFNGVTLVDAPIEYVCYFTAVVRQYGNSFQVQTNKTDHKFTKANTAEQFSHVYDVSSAQVPGQSHTLLSTKLLLMVHPGVPPSSEQMKGSVTTPGPKQRWLKNRSKAGSRHPRSGHTSGLTEKDENDVSPTPHSSQL